MNTSSNIKKTALLLAAGLATTLAGTANAQRFQEIIGSERNETAYDIEYTRDGGYVTAGCRTGRINEQTGAVDPADFLVVKYDDLGNVLWSTQYGTGEMDAAFSIHQTEDGGYIVAGQTEGMGDRLNLALLRLDAGGSVIWAHVFRGDAFGELLNPLDPEAPPRVAVRESVTGDIIVVANAFEAPAGGPFMGQGGIFLRTDAGGFPLVQRFFALPSANPDIATNVAFTDLKELPNLDVVISGWVQNAGDQTAPFPRDMDALALRTDPSGAPIWINRYDEIDAEDFSNEEGYGLDVGPNGGPIVMSSLVDGGFGVLGAQHYWLDTASGALIDARQARDFKPSFAATRVNSSLEVATAGEFDIGQVFGAGAAISYDAAAGFQWLGTYGPNTGGFMNKLEAIAPSRPCGWAIAGIKTLPMFGGEDIHLVKVNDSGDSGCEQEFFEIDSKPEVRYQPMDIPHIYFQEWTRWGERVGVQLGYEYLCFEDRCVDPRPCLPDLTTTNTNPGDPGYGVPDGMVDGADLSFYVEAWLNSRPIADFTTTNTNPGDPGYGVPDGNIDGADLSFYVEAWLRGCP